MEEKKQSYKFLQILSSGIRKSAERAVGTKQYSAEYEIQEKIENLHGVIFRILKVYQSSSGDYNEPFKLGGKYSMYLHSDLCCESDDCIQDLDVGDKLDGHMTVYSGQYENLEVCYSKLMEKIHNVFKCKKCRITEQRQPYKSSVDSDDESNDKNGKNESKDSKQYKSENKEDKKEKEDKSKEDKKAKESKVMPDTNDTNDIDLICDNCLIHEDLYLHQPEHIKKRKLFDCYICGEENINKKHKAELKCSGSDRHTDLMCKLCFETVGKCPQCRE